MINFEWAMLLNKKSRFCSLDSLYFDCQTFVDNAIKIHGERAYRSVFFNMSSGVGVKGTLGRCYPFFADLKKCVVSEFLFASYIVRVLSFLSTLLLLLTMY